jgi:hypothetical protein
LNLLFVRLLPSFGWPRGILINNGDQKERSLVAIELADGRCGFVWLYIESERLRAWGEVALVAPSSANVPFAARRTTPNPASNQHRPLVGLYSIGSIPPCPPRARGRPFGDPAAAHPSCCPSHCLLHCLLHSSRPPPYCPPPRAYCPPPSFDPPSPPGDFGCVSRH